MSINDCSRRSRSRPTPGSCGPGDQHHVTSLPPARLSGSRHRQARAGWRADRQPRFFGSVIGWPHQAALPSVPGHRPSAAGSSRPAARSGRRTGLRRNRTASSRPVGLLQVLPRFLSCPSVARLFLVPEGQNIHRIVGRFVAVQGHIAGIPEGNHQLAQLGHFRERPANVRGRLQQQELPLNGLAGTPGGVRCLDGQEPPASFQAIRRAFGDDYLWQSGTALSSLVPQVFNQVRTSWPVRWRPVSL